MVTTYNEIIASSTSGRISLTIAGAILPDIRGEQDYFWTEKWQGWEREADEDLRQGRFREFPDGESLLRDLHEG